MYNNGSNNRSSVNEPHTTNCIRYIFHPSIKYHIDSQLPQHVDSFVDDLYCNGIVTAYQIQPVDVCISESMSSSSMFQCNNGRILQLQWYNTNNCSGSASYTSDNYCDSFNACTYCLYTNHDSIHVIAKYI